MALDKVLRLEVIMKKAPEVGSWARASAQKTA
jgi:hypothetical protein